MIDVLSCSEFKFDVHDIKIQALAGNICNSHKSLNKEVFFFIACGRQRKTLHKTGFLRKQILRMTVKKALARGSIRLHMS